MTAATGPAQVWKKGLTEPANSGHFFFFAFGT